MNPKLLLLINLFFTSIIWGQKNTDNYLITTNNDTFYISKIKFHGNLNLVDSTLFGKKVKHDTVKFVNINGKNLVRQKVKIGFAKTHFSKLYMYPLGPDSIDMKIRFYSSSIPDKGAIIFDENGYTNSTMNYAVAIGKKNLHPSDRLRLIIKLTWKKQLRKTCSDCTAEDIQYIKDLGLLDIEKYVTIINKINGY